MHPPLIEERHRQRNFSQSELSSYLDGIKVRLDELCTTARKNGFSGLHYHISFYKNDIGLIGECLSGEINLPDDGLLEIQARYDNIFKQAVESVNGQTALDVDIVLRGVGNPILS